MRIRPPVVIGLGIAAFASVLPVIGQDGPDIRTGRSVIQTERDPWASLRRSRDPGAAPAQNPGARADDPLAQLITGSIPAETVAEPEGDPRNPRAVRQRPETFERELETASTNPPRPVASEDDPFAALGIRAGSYIIFPAVETAAGYTTNASGVAGGSAAPFVTIRPELSIRSDWALHAFRLDLRGAYQAFTAGAAADRPTATIDAALRLDLPARWQADFAAGYELRNESLTDPSLPAGVDVPAQSHIFDAAGAVSRPVGPLLVEAGADVTRSVYSDALAAGIPIDQSDRDNLVFTGHLRLGTDYGRIVRPFVEGIAGRRLYDVAVDPAGNSRSATIAELRGGFAYDSAPVLTAEIAAGYRWEDPDAPGQPALSGATIEANAVWSPRRLITVALSAATFFNPSSTALAGGSIAREVALDASWALRPDIVLSSRLGFRGEQYAGIGTDRTTSLSAAATWKIHRSLWLTGRYTHQWFRSYDPARSADSDTIEVGLRLQR